MSIPRNFVRSNVSPILLEVIQSPLEHKVRYLLALLLNNTVYHCNFLYYHLPNNYTLFYVVFLLVVVFVSDFYIAREGMLHAYDEGMTKGDYAFIMFELDQTQVALYTRQPFKWFFSSYRTTLNRYHHVKEAFEAALVLAIKSPSSESYPKFTAELKRRAPDKPFDSHVYEGFLWAKNSKFLANKTEVSDSCKIRFR